MQGGGARALLQIVGHLLVVQILCELVARFLVPVTAIVTLLSTNPFILLHSDTRTNVSLYRNRSLICEIETENGNFSFPCSCFNQSSIYRVKTSSDNSTLSLLVPEPELLISNASLFHQQTVAIIVSSLCKPVEFLLQIFYRPSEVPIELEKDLLLLAVLPISIKDRITNISLDCSYFSLPGRYTLHLFSPSLPSFETRTELELLEEVGPRLSVRTDSIFPYCEMDLSLSWSSPSCNSSLTSSYFLRVLAGDVYLDEQLLSPEAGSSVIVPCGLFDIIHPIYCFQLVSVDRWRRSWIWHQVCVPTEPEKRVHGMWEAWNTWSTCSPSCSTGPPIMQRLRYCTSPAPADNGKFCTGPMVEYQPCDRESECRERTKVERLYEDACYCGCEIREREGLLVIARGENCSSSQESLAWSLISSDLRRRRLSLTISRHHIDRQITRLVIFADQDLIFDSFSSTKLEFNVIDRENVTIVLTGSAVNNSETWIGALIEYRWTDLEQRQSLSSVNIPHIIVLVLLGFLIGIPPGVCYFLTIHEMKRKHRSSSDTRLFCLRGRQREDEDLMIRSGDTECTAMSSAAIAAAALSCNSTVKQRSIGVQQSSMQSTPPTMRGTPRAQHSSSCAVSDLDLEFDYYEDPGSYFFDSSIVDDLTNTATNKSSL